MARPKSVIPTYRLHKASGQACAYVGRERKYLGLYGSAESKRRFSELVAQFTSAGPSSAPVRESCRNRYRG